MNAVLMVVILCLCLMKGGWAHDVGVSEAVLVELPNARYDLIAAIPQPLAHLIQPPILPEQCHFTDDPRMRRTPAAVRFGFACEKGRLTSDDTLRLPWMREGIVLQARWVDGAEAQSFFPSGGGLVTIPLSRLQAGSGSLVDAGGRTMRLGVEHILFGIDHLLFILSLLLIVRGRAMLLGTITAFTVAHSLTLGLATLDLVRLPSAPVEASIALSIVFVVAESVRAGPATLTRRFPWIAAFAFGLLHGFGFAGALAEIGLPAREIPMALLFFNLGVEAGQLAFVAVVLGGVAFARRWLRSAPAWSLSVPAYGIGAVSTLWLIERIQAMIQS